MTFTVPADHIEGMDREIGTGITKADSQFANIDAQHALFWDQSAASQDIIKATGGFIDIVGEVPAPLLNDDFDQSAPTDPREYTPLPPVAEIEGGSGTTPPTEED